MHHRAVAVVIHGVEYPDMQTAGLALGLSADQVRRRVNSTITTWSEWRRKDEVIKATSPSRSTRKVKIKGVEYASVTEAAKVLKLTHNQLYGRLVSTSVEFADYEFVDKFPTRISRRTKNVVVVVDGVQHPTLHVAGQRAGVTPHGLRNRMRNSRDGRVFYQTTTGERIA